MRTFLTTAGRLAVVLAAVALWPADRSAAPGSRAGGDARDHAHAKPSSSAPPPRCGPDGRSCRRPGPTARRWPCV